MRIFISAGEPSGDLHGANLARALARRQPQVELFGFGGDKMAAAGCTLVYPLCQHAVMGFIPVLAALPKFARILALADRWFRDHKPDAVVLIDYPGLHWWLARRAKEQGIPVFYFVPPQIWAWGTWRVRKMRRYVDHVLCALPFEEPWYRRRGVPAQFIGHPYFDELAEQPLNGEFLAAERGRPGRVVALLPGSRTQEVVQNLPMMLGAALHMQRRLPDVRFLAACFKPAHQEMAREYLAGHDLPINLHVGRTAEIIHLAEACMAVSGSVGLELLHHQKPTAVLYKTSSLAYYLGRHFIHSKYISLVNLLARRELFPEFPGARCKSESVAKVVERWLTDAGERDRLVAELGELRTRVGQPGACDRAAGYIVEAISGRSHVTREVAA